jgi:hypothetical protein
VDNVKIGFGERRCGGMDWIVLALVRDNFVNKVINLQVP